MTTTNIMTITTLLVILLARSPGVSSLNIVIAGGTGRLGPKVAAKLSDHKVTLLARNGFLASAPARVTGTFGWVGRSYLENNPHVSIRDWDGGDMTDIVGCDFLGWQDDALQDADVVVNLVGGYTQQREMATERIVRESLRINPQALQITASPVEDDIRALTPGAFTMKLERMRKCEEMVTKNCMNSNCLRLEAFDVENSVQTILDAVLSAN
mmetsp:Transcript_11018/g.18270  ORF Transcript_11018/g.18270 Transcript_11018/m.18270 type:complete len:212 (-) Transcript_11018:127-762(-)|eukprot:CAMPEP_0119009910 /NCGR_PEP_ID=MMETSP1176-20130426/4672_1 /TAXON_ID=265551 /ORGANISM="Synedropsis recta cf, Strain CCMP1620" /LENGTH=211 /DNA_ID=CAMNT_0006962491 /DNA_START=25 /DNA_END=660 /DNA_ORIENTATION=-